MYRKRRVVPGEAHLTDLQDLMKELGALYQGAVEDACRTIELSLPEAAHSKAQEAAHQALTQAYLESAALVLREAGTHAAQRLRLEPLPAGDHEPSASLLALLPEPEPVRYG